MFLAIKYHMICIEAFYIQTYPQIYLFLIEMNLVVSSQASSLYPVHIMFNTHYTIALVSFFFSFTSLTEVF